MLELLGFPADSLTLAGLLGLAVLAILFGWLVPRKTLTDEQRETEHWRTAYENAERRACEQAEQIKELAELARTTHAIVAALPRRRDDRRSDDLAT